MPFELLFLIFLKSSNAPKIPNDNVIKISNQLYGFSRSAHKKTPANNPISIKDAAEAMGHNTDTHMDSYGSYTTELAIEKAFERHAANRIEA